MRKEVGYRRFETAADLAALSALYAALRVYKNFFQPALKLKAKSGWAAGFIASTSLPLHSINRYSIPAIECCGGERLRKQYDQLKAVELRRDIDRLRNALWWSKGHSQNVVVCCGQ